MLSGKISLSASVITWNQFKTGLLRSFTLTGSNDQALVLTNDDVLSDRRNSLCRTFMTEMTESREQPLAFLVQLPMLEAIPCNLRPHAMKPTKPLKRTKTSQDFFTTRYHV